jgi:hypothetical protein
VVDTNSSSKKIRFGTKKEIKIDYDDGNLSTEIKDDRVTFTVKAKQRNKQSYTHIVTLKTASSSVYLPSLEYVGWIVDGKQEIWTDFNSPSAQSVSPFEVFDGVWEIRVVSTSPDVTFSSTGELNCATDSFSVGTIESGEEYLTPMQCPDSSIQSVLLYALIFVVLIGFYLVSKLIIKVPIMTMIACLLFIPYFYSMVGCSSLIGQSGIIFAILMAVAEAWIGVNGQ